MITFRKDNNLLILTYEPDRSDVKWVHDILDKEETFLLKRTFLLKQTDLYIDKQVENVNDEFDSINSIEFVVGELINDYYRINEGVLDITHAVFLYKDIDIKIELFISYSNISIFQKIDSLANEDIYIGGEQPNSLPEVEFRRLLSSFPNTYELKKYAEARISVILRNYFDTPIDSESKYNKYMNKKVSLIGDNLSTALKENELFKYSSIFDKLQRMLIAEDSYTEKQWQNEILQIILLIFPKYIYVFKEVPVYDTYNEKSRSLDYLLIDSSGNTDIVEIKKPFNDCIVTKTQYRDNYIPMRELSGTVMQIEKYIFYLNKWGKNGEKVLTEKYKDKLPDNFQIQITNPNGIIVMGREIGLSKSQLQDFEVIKRKYKSIIDIITYDDLIRRLKFTIEQIKKNELPPTTAHTQ